MHFSISLSAAVVLLSSGLGASAHGFPISLTVDGKTYSGANGAAASGDSPFRKVSSGSPVTDPSSNDIVCGLDSKTASSSASVNPGSELQISWGPNSGGGNWVHNVGPIMTYMAACDGDCSSFSPDASTEWFKIDEQGQSTEGDSSTWAQAKLNNGSPATVSIPDGLASGNYLVRHEIIALQNSQTEGGTEYYPRCLQVTVGGSGSGQPDTTVNFPGAYTKTDAGILGNFYNPGTVYVFPGGDVANIGGGSDSSSGDSSPSSASSSTKTVSSSEGGASSTAVSVDPATSTPAGAVPTGVANVAPSPSSSSTASSTTATPSGTPCRSSSSKKRSSAKKSKFRRRAAAASGNGTSDENPSRRSLKMHRKRVSALAASI